ncbi:polysaccharide pyruvyl transferase CsaB [Jeotgalibacillus marinus]|uniref:Polysaccharide pyruvyl transferase CsaB n=1 Tax=Jeotgalibacillus marinus TaxID=86667 RepID=A0ABV3Q4L5_9BACL
MRIVLSGYYGFDNVGDDAILYAIIHSLKEYDPQVEIVVLSQNPKETEEIYHVDSVKRWSIKEITKALKNADCLISGGGSLLQDKTGRKSIPYYAGVMKIAQWLNKPVFVYAQGMGPFKSKINQLIIKNTLQSTKILTVRDSQSKQLLEKIGVTKPIQIVPDPVIGIDTSNFRSDWMESKNFSQRTITVSIRDWSDDLSYLDEIALALDELSGKGYIIILVPMHGERDQKTSNRVKEMMKQEVFIAPHNSSIQEKMAIIKASDVLLGMRLHALIFASVGFTPFVAISYDPKVDSFASIVNQEVVGNVKDKNWDYNDIVSSIENIFLNYSQEVNKLKSEVISLQKIASTTAKNVIDSFSDETLIPPATSNIKRL